MVFQPHCNLDSIFIEKLISGLPSIRLDRVRTSSLRNERFHNHCLHDISLNSQSPLRTSPKTSQQKSSICKGSADDYFGTLLSPAKDYGWRQAAMLPLHFSLNLHQRGAFSSVGLHHGYAVFQWSNSADLRPADDLGSYPWKLLQLYQVEVFLEEDHDLYQEEQGPFHGVEGERWPTLKQKLRRVSVFDRFIWGNREQR